MHPSGILQFSISIVVHKVASFNKLRRNFEKVKNAAIGFGYRQAVAKEILQFFKNFYSESLYFNFKKEQEFI